MYNFNKRQKIVIGIFTFFVIIGICYYVYFKDDGIEIFSQDDEGIELVQNNRISENKIDENKINEDKGEDDFIIVYITGAVNKEGIVELKVGSRIADAIDKVGGIKNDACIEEINLAYVLEDGMKVYIPYISDIKEKKEEADSNLINIDKDLTNEYVTFSSGVSNIDKNNDNSVNTNKSIKESKVNINTATQTQLETLPGIGPSTALKIISYRQENGKFNSIEDIKQVNGIGESKFNNIKDLICIN